jgi:hypothetical protein
VFRHFADVLRAADFQSFQAMATDTNAADIRAMVRALGGLRAGHARPLQARQRLGGRVRGADLRAILTDRYLAEVARRGLFAMNFMDGTNLAASAELHGFVRRAVRRYAGS